MLDANKPGLRAAAGIDVMSRRGIGFPYAFLETVTGNPIGAQLNPAGTKGLMTFQNLFGIVGKF